MLKNYFKIAFRNIYRNKVYSFINLLGFSVGMACSILIILYVRMEFSYDKYHENKELLYRVVKDDWIGTPAALANAIQLEIPEIQKAISIDYFTRESGVKAFKYEDKQFNEEYFFLADPGFFDMFSFEFILGDKKTALDDPNSIVITDSTASRYFGNEDPIGKILVYENRKDFRVTGVIKNIPQNTHFKFDMVAPFKNMPDLYGNDYNTCWGCSNFETYILLNENASIDNLADKIGNIFMQYSGRDKHDFIVQKVTDVHLRSKLRGELGQNGSLTEIIIFSAIALIVLLIACVNYVNLAIARFSKRIKEIGMRKIVGANKFQIIRQFLGEAIVLCLVSLVFAVILVEIFLPMFNNIIGKELVLYGTNKVFIITGLIFFAIITGILSGSYPAFHFSRLPLLKLMKGDFIRRKRGITLSKVMVISQFSISVFFIIFILMIRDQIKYINTTDMGFTKENLIVVPLGEKMSNKFLTFREELLTYTDIEDVSFSKFGLGDPGYHQTANWEGQDEKIDVSMFAAPVDEHFINTYKIQILKGKDFTDGPLSQYEYIINENAVELIGVENPIGLKFNIFGEGRIIGIVKDFNFLSLHAPIMPIVFSVRPKLFSNIAIRISEENISTTLRIIENTWNKIISDRPFSSSFFEDQHNSLYQSEQKAGKIFGFVTLMAIFISCIGLFGIASFTSEQRTKEVGIRKSLGSSVKEIVILLTKEFAVLVLIANIIAWPIVFLVIRKWLQNFSYHTDIKILIFIAAGLFTLLLALLTIGFQSIKAANTNPVDTLRYE
ncbi:ABC transporter permease [Bacteroidota bacterium]